MVSGRRRGSGWMVNTEDGYASNPEADRGTVLVAPLDPPRDRWLPTIAGDPRGDAWRGYWRA